MLPVIKTFTIFNWQLGRNTLKGISVFMITLLVFMTSLNFVIYGGKVFEQNASGTLSQLPEDLTVIPQTNPAGPDEKTPEAPSLLEEFVHKHAELEKPYWTDHKYKYMIAQSEDLLSVHFEILSPPPELS